MTAATQALVRRGDEPSRRVLIVGNPNSGKSTLFNALSGGSAQVANYPGVTIDRASSQVTLGATEVELVDVPGTYSLTARSPEEQIAVDAMLDRSEPRVVVCVVDATTLTRGLYLAFQIIEAGVPTVIALNMMDAVEKSGIEISVEELSRRLGAPVVPIVASRKRGLERLRDEVERVLLEGAVGSPPPLSYPRPVEDDIQALMPEVERWAGEEGERELRARALWCLLSVDGDELLGIPASLRTQVQALMAVAQVGGRNVDEEIIGARYAFLDEAVAASTKEPSERPLEWSERIDSVLTHRVWGLVVFALVMYGIFEALFTWAEPFIAAIEVLIATLQDGVVGVLGQGPFQDLMVNGVIAGVGNVLVFVPQILMLFLFIAFLEDSGYLARVAFVIDRVMSGVGLHGRAFVPLLSGFACAIPAVMATRTIESRRDRLVTMLALPLMSCSARLPVYLLVIATVFGGVSKLFGLFNMGAVALFIMYTLSVIFTLGAASVLRRTVLRGPTPVFVLELPDYRWPVPLNIWLSAWRRLKSFLVDAGTIILALTIVLWALLSYPKDAEIAAQFTQQRAVAAATLSEGDLPDALATLDAREAAAQLEQSIAGRTGKLIEPVIRPLGFDWRLGVGIIGAFAAREVFVSTLGIVFGIGETDEESTPLRQALQEAKHSDGTPVMTPLAGASLMLFFLLACQCMSTIAVVRRESGSWRWPLLMFAYMTVLAYVGSLVVYQGGRLLGFV